MKFKQYLLTEKVNKKELRDALSNENIIVGGEFEFIIPDMIFSVEGALMEWENFVEAHNDSRKYKEIDPPRPKDYFGPWSSEGYSWYLNITGLNPRLEYELRNREYLEEETYYELLVLKPKQDVLEKALNSAHHQEHWLEKAQKVLPEILKTAPFKKWEIGGYDEVYQESSSDPWAVEYDSSLGDGGVEIASPPLSLPEFLSYMEKMFKWIDKVGYTTDKCGFHIHMSVKGIENLLNHIDMIKLILFTEEDYIYKEFKSRKYSKYTRSSKGKMGSFDVRIALQDIISQKSPLDILKNLDGFHDHNDSIRAVVKGTHSHLEFRYLGGKNYHKKYDKITSNIGRYAHTVSISMDPEYKKKEYIKKIFKIQKIIDNITKKAKLEISVWVADQIINQYKKKISYTLNSDQIKEVKKRRKENIKEWEKMGTHSIEDHESMEEIAEELAFGNKIFNILNMITGIKNKTELEKIKSAIPIFTYLRSNALKSIKKG